MINISKRIEENRIKERLKLKSNKKSKTSTKHVSIRQSSFMDKLFEIQETETINEELNSILEDIDKEGRKFSKDPNLENLKRYKSLIKSFIDRVVNKMYKIKETTKFSPRRNKTMILITIETINKKLEKLTKFIVDKEKTNINLISTLDEIRGLLLDLYK